MSDESPSDKNACPSCGVAVVPGYKKCPKCKAILIKGVERSGGGTAVDGRHISMYLVLLVAAATAAVTYLANRDEPGDQGAPIVSKRKARADDRAVDGGDAGGEALDADEREEQAAEIVTVLRNMEAILDKRGVRVWAELDPARERHLLIHSDDCEEVEVQVSQLPDDVSQLASTVQCLDRFGHSAFDAKLK